MLAYFLETWATDAQVCGSPAIALQIDDAPFEDVDELSLLPHLEHGEIILKVKSDDDTLGVTKNLAKDLVQLLVQLWLVIKTFQVDDECISFTGYLEDGRHLLLTVDEGWPPFGVQPYVVRSH
jgi:hypothetical protein